MKKKYWMGIVGGTIVIIGLVFTLLIGQAVRKSYREKDSFAKIGYEEYEVNLFYEFLTEQERQILLDHNYIPKIDLLVQDSHYQSAYFPQYIAYMFKHPDVPSPSFTRFFNLGYTLDEVELFLEKLDDSLLQVLREKAHIPQISAIINHRQFQKEQFASYLDYALLHPTEDPDQFIPTLNIPEEKRLFLANLPHDPYYLKRNQERYVAYYDKVGGSVRKVVTSVNSNIDHTFYQDTVKADLSKGILLLVNKFHSLDSSYVPEDLTLIDHAYSTWGSLKRVTYDAFLEMAKDAEQEGYHLQNFSPYRSYDTQYHIYYDYVRQNGQREADTHSARPGYSEHQTGLALDIKTPTSTMYTMEKTKECQWLFQNAHKYGFILRYPKGKEYLTGYMYEPWHYRYVGVEVATYIYEHDMVFEEYYEYFLK